MNIADKRGLYAEAARVLRPDGRIALHEIMAGPVAPYLFPVPWARDPSMSFLISPEDTRSWLVEAGLKEHDWEDVSEVTLAAMPPRPVARATSTGSASPIGLSLLVGDDFPELASNLARNLAERRIVVVQGVFERA